MNFMSFMVKPANGKVFPQRRRDAEKTNNNM
jgi:hypothetical protein